MSSQLDFIYDSEIFIDLYNILEIESDAKHDEIKIAYIKLAKKNHPDQGGISEKFQEITKAYEILYNKEIRKEYDLYYIKKSYDEFKSDEIIRMRKDFENFKLSQNKQISKEEIDKLYEDIFSEYREQINNNPVFNQEELYNRINDIKIERNNQQIETEDNTLENFMKENSDNINVNDVFEYLKYKNNNSFNNDIVVKEFGTLDTLPGYLCNTASFINEDEYLGSNLYTNISDINSHSAKEYIDKLNINDFMQWKNMKQSVGKLSDSDINEYLKKRQLEQDNIFIDVETKLSSTSKKKEVETFLKTHIPENIISNSFENEIIVKDKSNKKPKQHIKKSNLPELMNLDGTKSDGLIESTYQNSKDIDDILKFMEDIKVSNIEDYGELEKEIGMEKKENYFELKYETDKHKINNIKKKELK